MKENHYYIVGCVGLCLFGIFMIAFTIYIFAKRLKGARKRLHDENPGLIKYNQKIKENTIERHELIDRYALSMEFCRTEIKNYLASQALFGKMTLSTSLVMMRADAIALCNHVKLYLYSDINQYLSGELKDNCIKEYRMFGNMLNDIGKIINNRPTLALQLYSDYFCQLLKICQYITEGVKSRYSQNQGLIVHVNSIESLIAEYQPIAKLYDGAVRNSKEIKRKINEKYRGRIQEVTSMDSIWDDTVFLVLDDMIIFIKQYYTEMDIINAQI